MKNVFILVKYAMLFCVVTVLTIFMFYYSGFVATVYLYIIFYLFFLFILHSFLKKPVVYQNVKFSVFTLMVLLLIAEAVIYFGHTKRPLTTEELLEMDFYGLSLTKNTGAYYINPKKGDTISISNSEFIHERYTNAEGIRELIVTPKTDGEFRILCLGDSFTEGVGSTMDSSWVAVCQDILSHACTHVKLSMINAGIRGSDPFYEYKLLKERLLKYEPDVVIALGNTSDVFDYIERGGFSRYQPNGKVAYREHPVLMPLYYHSFIYRQIVHGVMGLDMTFNTAADRKRLELEAIDSMQTAFLEFEKLGNEFNFEMVVCIVPAHGEVAVNGYSFQEYNSLVKNHKHSLDMLECMRQYTPNNTVGGEINYWPIDGHYNGRGYQIMGKCMAAYLLEQFPCNNK